MNSDYLLEGLTSDEDSAISTESSSESTRIINELIESTIEELRDNEIKEAASVECAMNDFSVQL